MKKNIVLIAVTIALTLNAAPEALGQSAKDEAKRAAAIQKKADRLLTPAVIERLADHFISMRDASANGMYLNGPLGTHFDVTRLYLAANNGGIRTYFEQQFQSVPSFTNKQLEFLSQGLGLTYDESRALQAFPDEMDAGKANMLLLKQDFETNHPENASRRIDQWAMKHPSDYTSFNFFAWTAAENGVDLDKAEQYAKRAIILAPTSQEKAEAEDTRAEVLFKSGKNSEASEVESAALSLLDPDKDKKLYAELTSQKAKFDKAKAKEGSTIK